MHAPVLDHRRAQHDAGIHLTIGAEIADAAGIGAARIALQLVDDLHRSDFWRARDRSGREACDQGTERIVLRVDLAFDIRDDVHDLAVALDEERIGDLDRADLGDTADIVAPEIEQHQVLGALLRVCQQLFGESIVLGLGRAAPPRAGDRPDRDSVVAQAHQDFGARADDLEVAEIEIAQERRRIDPPQRPVKRERRQRERRLEALRQHDLEDVAGADVLLRLVDHLQILGLARVRGGRRGRQVGDVDLGLDGEGAFKGPHHGLQPLLRPLIGMARTDARHVPDRRDDMDLVAHGVEHHHQRRPRQDRVGDAGAGLLRLGQALHQAHHVVAEIAEHAGRHRRQALGLRNGTLFEQGAQALESRARIVEEALAQSRAAERGLAVMAAPDQVRLQPDHRIAAAHGAALDRFEQEGRAGRGMAQLQEGGDRRLAIADQHLPQQLRGAGLVSLREVLELLERLHRQFCAPPVALRKAASLMLTPSSACRLATYCSRMSSLTFCESRRSKLPASCVVRT